MTEEKDNARTQSLRAVLHGTFYCYCPPFFLSNRDRTKSYKHLRPRNGGGHANRIVATLQGSSREICFLPRHCGSQPHPTDFWNTACTCIQTCKQTRFILFRQKRPTPPPHPVRAKFAFTPPISITTSTAVLTHHTEREENLKLQCVYSVPPVART